MYHLRRSLKRAALLAVTGTSAVALTLVALSCAASPHSSLTLPDSGVTAISLPTQQVNEAVSEQVSGSFFTASEVAPALDPDVPVSLPGGATEQSSCKLAEQLDAGDFRVPMGTVESSEEASSAAPSVPEEPEEDSSGEAVAAGNFVYYQQTSDTYRNVSYGNQTIGNYGCGPTNMAMVIATLKDKTVTPVTMARFAERNNCFVYGAGTSHAFFQIAANAYGLNYASFTGTTSAITSALRQGKMIICSMNPGSFTDSAHFLLLRGITADGGILVADSASPDRTQKVWSVSLIVSQLRYSSVWSFWK